MTLEEAIRTIKVVQAEVEWEYPMDYATAFDMAISALDKQIPQKPKMPLDAYWVCPTCGRKVEMPLDAYWVCPTCGRKVEHPFEHCRRCGQAIDWTEGEV